MIHKNNKPSMKQVVLFAVGALILLLLALSTVLNFVTTKYYVEEQLAQHSHEAATFLGLALSSQERVGDPVLRARVIDSIFDSGNYAEILFHNAAGAAEIERVAAVVSAEVPAWFYARMYSELRRSPGQAQVMSGWQKIGTVQVVANPSLAISELWSLFKDQILLFALVLMIGLFALNVMLRKLLKPLGRLEVQAQHIANRSFEQLSVMPSTRELDSVARSLNEMSSNLKRVFEEQIADIERMRESARKDSLTGLFNREGFDARLKSDLTDRSVSGVGVLVLLVVNDFGEFNVKHGREVADQLLKDVAAAINAELESLRGMYAARRMGAQFSVFLPGMSPDAAETLVQKLMARILGLQVLRQALRDDWVHVGIAEVDEAETVGALLSKADLALRQAQEKTVSGWQRYVLEKHEGVVEEVRQATHWQKILRDVLATNDVVLHEQPVKYLNNAELSHKQVLSRIEVDGQLIVASTFLPMAKRFGLMVLFDEMVVEKVFEALAISGGDEPYHITLSEAAIADELFMEWLTSHLQANQQVLSRVTFEIPEHALGFGEGMLSKLCDLGDRWGFKVCIDRFGISSIPFNYLQRIKVSAIKIDSSFIRNVHLNQDNQFFIRAAVQIAHSQNIKVIAIGVETEEELAVLKEIGVDSAMGYIFQRPSLANF